METPYVLIIVTDIADEDGPSIMYYLIEPHLININEPYVIVKNNSGNMDDIIEKSKYIEGDLGFKNIFKKFKIIRVIEVHDWYDSLTDDEVLQEQKRINKEFSKNEILPHDTEKEYILITVNEYNQPLQKFMIPKDIYFEIPDAHDFRNTMRDFEVNTSYDRILSQYFISGHNYYLVDLDYEDDNKETPFTVSFRKT